MKTVVRALTERRFVDGWGNETTLRRPSLIPGECYLLVDNEIKKRLLTLEEIMERDDELEVTWLPVDYYE